MKRNNRIFVLSVLVSVLVHLALLSASYFLWVPGASGLTEQAYKMFDIKSVELDPARLSRQTISEGRVEKLKFEKPAHGIDKYISTHIIQPRPVQAAEELPPPLQLGPTLREPQTQLSAPETSKRLKEDLSIKPKKAELQPAYPKAKIPDFYHPEPGFTGGETAFEIPEEYFEETASFAPAKAVKGANLPRPAGSSLSTHLPGGFDHLHAYKPDPAHESLDQFLSVMLYTYQDPADGQKYFQLSVYPSYNTENLEVMPKEVIFLMDASLSIRQRRLHKFKEGVKYALQNLNPGDKFNIYVFKNIIIPFAEESLPADNRSIGAALYFLDTLQPSRTTDIYKAFLETVQKPAAMYPSYIILLSDGKATEGIQSTSKLIRQISRVNNGERPIFTVAGGGRNDRFLLDFLAYPNRGWSEFSPVEARLDEKMMEFYDKIRNPVLVNVRYQVTPLAKENIFPQDLPDFYRDTIFTLYGRYDKDTKFSLRLLGDIGASTKEFIFTYDLTQAPKGSEDIARLWAFNKIYDLISEMTLAGPSREHIEEIKRLTERFDIRIPYELEKIF